MYDLAVAFVKVLGNPVAYKNTYNISGERFVTFDGIARACAQAMGKGEPELVHYNPKEFDFGKAKAFPLRDQHFFASVDKAMKELGWRPKFGLVDGLRDSYEKVCAAFISGMFVYYTRWKNRIFALYIVFVYCTGMKRHDLPRMLQYYLCAYLLGPTQI